MNEIKGWKDRLDTIVTLKRDLDNVAAKNLLHESTEIHQVAILISDLSGGAESVIESIKAEDNSRELYTLDTVKADLVQLPTFEGRVDEDFAKFKDEVEDAFIQNRVSKSNKFKKLREVLKGHAKKLVPESLTGSIDEAWEVLDKAFGNPQRLMNYRRDTLLKLGPLPKASVKDGDKAQVEWYLQVETLVKGII